MNSGLAGRRGVRQRRFGLEQQDEGLLQLVRLDRRSLSCKGSAQPRPIGQPVEADEASGEDALTLALDMSTDQTAARTRILTAGWENARSRFAVLRLRTDGDRTVQAGPGTRYNRKLASSARDVRGRPTESRGE